ncbi:MAG: hypothetical protein U1E50_17970 [Caulobacteraceae bacterium]
MLRAFLKRQITAMERRYAYDASYLHDLIATDPWAALKFGLVASLGHLPGAPREAHAAAGICGVLAEDCGPCTQISVDMALEGGVKPEVLRAILAADPEGMGPAAWLAYRFAKASLVRDMETADPLRDEIVRRWGKNGLTAIALALTTARLYPTLKYALGHGKTCSRVVVAGGETPFARPFAEAA